MDYSHPNKRRYDLAKPQPAGDDFDDEKGKDHEIPTVDEDDDSGAFEAWIRDEGELPELPTPEIGEQPRIQPSEEDFDPEKDKKWREERNPNTTLPRGHIYLN